MNRLGERRVATGACALRARTGLGNTRTLAERSR